MKQKALSLFLVLLLFIGILPGSASAAFNDIYDPSTALAAAVLEGMGIVNGIAENTYAPNQGLTRAEFCAIAVRALGLEDEVQFHSYRTIFSDVKPGSWYTGYVNLAYTKGIINGYGDGKFGPDDGVNYGQAATILLRLLGYTAKDIGNSWPADYAYFANDLGLQKGLWLNAETPLNRGQAAIIVYNTLGTKTKGGDFYYSTIKGVAYTKEAIVLNTNATNAGNTGLLMACIVGDGSPYIEYHNQKIRLSDMLTGNRGRLLFDSAGRAIGFIPVGNSFMDIAVASANSAGITSSTGATHKIPSGAKVIYNGSLYNYGGGGYLQVESQAGRNVRLFYDGNGTVSIIYISSGSSTGAVYAETNNAASELARKLGISTFVYSITKNGAAATAGDLARYDVAYYDAATRTMRVSDYKLTGYIEEASPNLSTAKTITVAGCRLEVLESALGTLKNFTLGSRVTLLLTDDCKVAAAYSATAIPTEMLGILSLDGKSVKLSDSGLVLTANTVSATPYQRGGLVIVNSTISELSCYSYTPNESGYQLDVANGKLGSFKLAPGCSIYEWTGDTTTRGYVHSLSGALGESSSNLSEITWTDKLSSSYISYYRLNSAGQVDVLLLKDVTGNCYEYGKLSFYTGANGIDLGLPSMPAYNNAVTLSNGDYPNGSPKYLWTRYASMPYNGISLSSHISGYSIVASVAQLTGVQNVSAQAFFRYRDRWYAAAGGFEIPVSANVQVHIKATDRWYSGDEGLETALTSGLPLTVYYDRTPGTGAQIRVIAAGEL